MIMKLMGICMILFATIVYSANKIALLKNRLDSTKRMHFVCKHIADQISFSLEPLPEILNKMEKEDLGEVGEFLEDLCLELTGGKNRSIKEVWHGGLVRFQKRLNFSPKTIQILKALGDRLGTMSKEIELENIRYTMDKLAEEQQLLEQSYLQSVKLYRSFGILIGIFLVILFI